MELSPSVPPQSRPAWFGYAAALAGSALAAMLRAALDRELGDGYPFLFSYAAVAAAAALGGWKPALLAVVASYLAADWLFIPPRRELAFLLDHHAFTAFAGFCFTSLVISWLAAGMRNAQERSAQHAAALAIERERLSVTLNSIGDAVIATDPAGRVTFLNPVGEEMTGWSLEEAQGRPLAEVFRIVNETTREPVDDPVTLVLRDGKAVELANHTALISRDGTERSIADSAAPIRAHDGRIEGVVLIFRDVTTAYRAKEALRRRSERSLILSQTLEELLVAEDPDAAVRELCPRVAAHIGADAFFYLRHDEGTEALTLRAWAGVPEEVASVAGRIEFGQAICGRVAKDRKAMVVEAIQDSSDEAASLVRSLGIQSYACNPLVADGRLLGTLSFASRTRVRFDEDEIEFLRTVAQHVALAVERLEKAATLRERERRLVEQAHLLNLTNDAVIVCDWEDRILYWNRGAAEIYGWRSEEAVGRVKHELLRTEFREPRAAILAQLEKENRWEGELIHTTRQGVRIVASTRWALDRDAAGRPAFVLKSDNDITARKSAEEALRRSEERLRLVADSIPALVSYVDRNLIYRFANAAYRSWFGREPSEIVGHHVKDVLGPDVFRHREPFVAAALRGETVRFEGPTLHRALGVRQTEITYVADRSADGEPAGFYVFVSDVTDRAEAQRVLEEQAQALREASRRKDEFLAMLAHELRNPLASVTSAAALLRASDDAENRLWALEVLQRQTGQLARLIDDLLDVSRITSGKVRLRKALVDAATIVRAATETVAPLVAERAHRLEMQVRDVDGPLLLEADPTRLEQIVSNLLANAAKYTEPGGVLSITAAREESPAGPAIVIAVRDNGIGIAPEKIPEMFELFTQGERSIARSEGGLGIGLTVVRKLAEMHGGSVSAHSEGLGKGSEFTVRLPVATEGGATVPDAAPESIHGGKGGARRILIVDDNADMARGLARLLRLSEHRVEVVFNGEEAIACARGLIPEFILLDIGLPGLDGYEVCRRLRREPCCQRATIIAISGYGQEEDRRRSSEAGFDHHLIKPVDLEHLKALLTKC